MTLVDYIILLVLVVSAGVGVWRGFVKEALSLLTLLVAIWLAWRFATLVAPKLSNWAADQDVREVDAGCAHLDDSLALAGLGLGHLLDDELLWLADALQDGGSQRPVN